MKLINLRQKFKSELSEGHGEDEALSFFYLLTEHFLDIRRIDIAKNPEIIIESQDALKFESSLARLKNDEPIQYIIGSTEFYGITIEVNSNTLIPRPETEELVDWVISDFSRIRESRSLLDIGTGSGCIAIALKKHLKPFNIHAWDVSSEALKVAKRNATLNKVEIEFKKKNILTKPKETSFDIIVSNPPYVRLEEKAQMKNNVLNHEPQLALFVENDDPLLFYRAIMEFSDENLNKNGAIYLEINEYLSEQMMQLLQSYGYNNIEIRQDFFGKSRMLKAIKP